MLWRASPKRVLVLRGDRPVLRGKDPREDFADDGRGMSGYAPGGRGVLGIDGRWQPLGDEALPLLAVAGEIPCTLCGRVQSRATGAWRTSAGVSPSLRRNAGP